MEDMGKLLIVFGVVIVIVGVVLVFLGKVPWLGKLPGDIVIQRDSFSCFFPIATSILVSVILTVVLNLIFRIINK